VKFNVYTVKDVISGTKWSLKHYQLESHRSTVFYYSINQQHPAPLQEFGHQILVCCWYPDPPPPPHIIYTPFSNEVETESAAQKTEHDMK
jgi:hypothetical protein